MKLLVTLLLVFWFFYFLMPIIMRLTLWGIQLMVKKKRPRGYSSSRRHSSQRSRFERDDIIDAEFKEIE